ncbi:hypothetical protein H2200_013503 [Cladophialophora chaetospira]|uniref:Reverse transcriptase n=1 Tax=Cladophialophora chaetospira TaxID=386627 RepID=A0AA38WVP4_9EURO|nr:hypothetical protein H2200_013503 [Cladophialophora chaetospira]
MASSALPETLRSVTSTKIQELKKQRDQYEASKNQIIREVKPCTDDLERTRKLLEGTCRQAGIPVVKDDSSDDDDSHTSASSDLANTRRNQQLFLRQAAKDPAFAPELVAQIHDDLAEHLQLNSVQHEHAQFFSELVTEWLSDTKTSGPGQSEATVMEDSSFESVGRKEMHEQRAQWESIVFTASDVDDRAVQNYLTQLFKAPGTVAKHFEEMETSTRKFCNSLRFTAELFDTDDLKNAIRGLLKTDLLSDEKAAILKSFQHNAAVLQEVADVLNMRFKSLETWKWSTTNGAISVEQRRQLNGKYRVFMDEDILDALLLHAIGMKWAVHFRSCLTHFFESAAWRTAARGIPQTDRDRRRWFLSEDSSPVETVEAKRKEQYAQDYFMSQLPITESEGTRGYDSDEDTGSARKNPIETKQGLLHLLITEALVANHLRPGVSHAVIRSDFEWFGPSLPHGTIFAVLKFFGVDTVWLGVFQEFLQAPMRFVQDGPDGQYHTRQRGVPMSHALSDAFGELILFVMDFAVNCATQSYLYRLHDDFWFWGTEDLCIRGWQAMTTFASVMGIKFNQEKTGSVVFNNGINSEVDRKQSDLGADEGRSLTTDVRLPKGDVRWGFLRLEAARAQFVIDQQMVDEHIEELRRQLSHCTSIFSYIQAYNAYLARFFSNNFGKPSYAFGRDHIDNMINTLVRVQNALFPDQSVTAYLGKLARERFGVQDVPDGVWYWPVQLGGMELRNPLVALYCMRETMRQSPQRILAKCLDAEEKSYISAKVDFDSHIRNYGRPRKLTSSSPGFGEQFMPKDEYMQYREERSVNLYNAYVRLLDVPTEFEVIQTKEITAWLDKLPNSRSRSAGILKSFNSIQPYWKWMLAVYGAQIVEKYGSVQIVDAAQVPLGVITLLKAGKVRWQG